MIAVDIIARNRVVSVVRSGIAMAAAVVFTASNTVLAEEADSRIIEEVTVTAQRVAESIQDVPIAVTALTGDALEERQVITPSDLQINASNVSFTATNFGGSSFSIRGIGNLVIGRSGEPGVSQHLNEIAVSTNLNTLEFFDMERVEVLRGPQGTLYGRNATGGVINFVTRKPDMGEVNGFVDFEYGNYDHARGKFGVNLPLGDSVAIRLAGFKLDRDGYTRNLAYGQTNSDGERLSGIDASVDGRGILAYRTTIAWEINDQARVWGLYSRFEEDDDRARITNQVCKQNPLPTTGCLADEFGWDSPHLGATTAGIFAGAAGALPFGATDGSYDYARPAISNFRQMHTDFEPVFKNRKSYGPSAWASTSVAIPPALSVRVGKRLPLAAGLRDGRRGKLGRDPREPDRNLAHIAARRRRGSGVGIGRLQPVGRHRRVAWRLPPGRRAEPGIRIRSTRCAFRILDGGREDPFQL